MDEVKRRRLQSHQDAILKDLDANDIMDELFTNDAIGKDDYDWIIRCSERSERTRYLLGVIKNGSNGTFDKFVDCLNKDYHWLHERLTNEEINGYVVLSDDTLEDSLSRGDVPRMPKNYVRRLKMETEIVRRLVQLKRHETVVLHGMLGSGKTTVAASVLRHHPDLIRDQFNGTVMWLNLSDCRTDDDVLAQQIKLYRKASALLGSRNTSLVNSTMSMSSLGSTLDISIASIDVNWLDFRDKLKERFSEALLKDCLLVLDDVTNKMSADAFDIGSKLVITTRDIGIVAHMNPEIFMISNNFAEQESLQLFANCLATDVNKLPPQAVKLHRLCDGDTFQIGFLAADMAENRERLIHGKKYWNLYVKKLANKEPFHNIFSRGPEHHKPTKPIEICINSLDEKLRSHFKTLAVLPPNNAKITAKALSTIWSESEPKVEAMLRQLEKKALITETFVHESKNYVYEVHDIILTFLRSLFKADELKDLHVKVLKSYGFDANSTSTDLIDDNYIAFFVGYHLCNTGNKNKEYRLFNRLFLDLKFLGNKIRLVGQADVIGDLNRYEDKICLSELDTVLHSEIVQFLKTYGNDLRKYPNTDIVQTVLQHTTSAILYGKAKEIALRGCGQNELYFEFLQEHNVEQIIPAVMDINEPVSAVSFLGNDVLVGTQKGKIKVYDVNTCQMSKEIVNSSYKIKTICVYEQNMSRVAVLSEDGTIKLWPTQHFIDEFTDGSDEEESRSNSISSQKTIDCSQGAHVNIQWSNTSNAPNFLLTHTTRKIIAYNMDGEVIRTLDNFEESSELRCMTQSWEGIFLMIGASGKSNHVHVLHSKSGKILASFNVNNQINQIICVPTAANRILVIAECEVIDISWKANGINIIPTSIIQSTICKLDRDDLYYSFATVNKNGKLLFLSQSNSQVECYDLNMKKLIFNLDNRRGNVVSMDMSERWPDEFLSDADVLVTATGDAENAVKVWQLEAAFLTNAAKSQYRSARLSGTFAAAFPANPPTLPGDKPRRNQSLVFRSESEKHLVKKALSLKPHSLNGVNGYCQEHELQPLLAVVDDKNSIQIMRGRTVKCDIPEETPIAKVQISPCSHYVVYGLKSGIVKKFTMRSNETERIMDLNSPIAYLEFINKDLLIVSGENRRIMAYFRRNDVDTVIMMARGNTSFGSQEILNEISGSRRMKSMDGDNHTEVDAKSERSNDGSPKGDRTFPGSKGGLYWGCQLVKCFWLEKIGMLSVAENESVKLWDTDLKMVDVLNGRRERDGNDDCNITCAAYRNRILVICDSYGVFQVFKLLRNEEDTSLYLRNYFKSQPSNKITACDLTRDGLLLAIATDSGHVALWNTKAKTQIALLRDHKTSVQSLMFSPHESANYASTINDMTSDEVSSDITPVVLISMATEIIWWNVTQIMKNRQRINVGRRGSRNVLTPLYSPSESLNNSLEFPATSGSASDGYFFANHADFQSWDTTWKGKKYKSGSNRKDILACIKLSGVSAQTLCVNEKFSCFATVDTTGAVHVMNVMRQQHT